MAKIISLDNVVQSSKDFTLDFGYLTITGMAELPAKLTFMAIMDFESSAIAPVERVLLCMPFEERIKTEALLAEAKQAQIEATDKGLDSESSDFVSKFADTLAVAESFLLKNGLGTLEDLQKDFARKLVNNGLKSIVDLFSHLITKSKNDNSCVVEFKVSDDSDGLSLRKKEALSADIANLTDINAIAHLIFQYYGNKDYEKIYNSLVDSVKSFLESIK